MTQSEIAEMFSDIKAALEYLESRKFYPEISVKAKRQAAWMRTRFWKLQGVNRWTAKRVRELQSFRDQVQLAFETICFEDYRLAEKFR